MQKLLIILIVGLTLSACTWVHRIDIEQGNIFNPAMINRLHRGMTFTQVKDIMGTPIVMNTFSEDRLDYVYTYKPGNGVMTEKYVTLFFKKGILVEIKESPSPICS